MEVATAPSLRRGWEVKVNRAAGPSCRESRWEVGSDNLREREHAVLVERGRVFLLLVELLGVEDRGQD